MSEAVERYFWTKVNKTDTCWLWTDSLNNGGYAFFTCGGEHYSAHRYSYELRNGPILDGFTIDHLCRVRHCVNPDHLEVVSQYENTARGEGHGHETYCPQGHLYSGKNLYITPDGSRQCRICRRVYVHAAERKRGKRVR